MTDYPAIVSVSGGRIADASRKYGNPLGLGLLVWPLPEPPFILWRKRVKVIAGLLWIVGFLLLVLAVASIVNPAKADWFLEKDVSEVSGRKTAFLQTATTHDISRGMAGLTTRFRLLIACRSDLSSMMVLINTDGIITKSGTICIDYKIDDEKPSRNCAFQETSVIGETYALLHGDKLVKTLLGKQKLIAEIPSFRGMNTARFDISGLEEKLPELKTSCGK